MRIQFASDLHLEFEENRRFLETHSFEVTGDILILAGDVFYLNDLSMTKLKFWKWASRRYKQVMLVPGNHEFYYHGDIAQRGDSWRWMFRSNVGYYYNQVVRIGDTDFIFSTLWSHISEENKAYVWRGMNDFRQILYDGRLLIPDDFNAEHAKCVAFLKRAVHESEARHIVVVTHHVPTLMAGSAHHKFDALSNAFYAELDNFIASSRIDCWLFGHSHENMDTTIGHTKILSNQLGYVRYGMGEKNFDLGRFVEI